MERGETPFMSGLAENGTRVRRAVTMFPATTVPCCASLYTGCWYKTHGLLNNEWMDRFASPPRGHSYVAGAKYALDSMDLKLFGWPSLFLSDKRGGGAVNNDFMAPTIYDTFTEVGKTSYTFFHYISRGATRWVRPSRTDMLRFAYIEKLAKPHQIYEQQMVTRAIQHVRRGMPDLLSIYFGCNDGHSHRHGVAAQADYLRGFVDPELARLHRALDRICPNDELFWAVTADHGQTTMPDEDRPRSVWYDTFAPVFLNAGFDSYDRGLSDKDIEPLDVVVTLGTGASLGFYVRNRQTRDWKTPPDFARDLIPALNNFHKASGKLSPFAEWKYPGYLDFLLTRKNFDEPYAVYDNRPPFDGEGKLIPLEEYFAARGPEYIRPVERIRSLDHPKGPDIILALNYQKHFNVNEESNFHPGQHGSLLEGDSLIPMLFSGPGVRRGEIEDALSIDFAPTASAMMRVDMPRADGKVLNIL
jgi:hypothetical protein